MRNRLRVWQQQLPGGFGGRRALLRIRQRVRELGGARAQRVPAGARVRQRGGRRRGLAAQPRLLARRDGQPLAQACARPRRAAQRRDGRTLFL
jgi:hypothetical protein